MVNSLARAQLSKDNPYTVDPTFRPSSGAHMPTEVNRSVNIRRRHYSLSNVEFHNAGRLVASSSNTVFATDIPHLTSQSHLPHFHQSQHRSAVVERPIEPKTYGQKKMMSLLAHFHCSEEELLTKLNECIELGLINLKNYFKREFLYFLKNKKCYEQLNLEKLTDLKVRLLNHLRTQQIEIQYSGCTTSGKPLPDMELDKYRLAIIRLTGDMSVIRFALDKFFDRNTGVQNPFSLFQLIKFDDLINVHCAFNSLVTEYKQFKSEQDQKTGFKSTAV